MLGSLNVCVPSSSHLLSLCVWGQGVQQLCEGFEVWGHSVLHHLPQYPRGAAKKDQPATENEKQVFHKLNSCNAITSLLFVTNLFIFMTGAQFNKNNFHFYISTWLIKMSVLSQKNKYFFYLDNNFYRYDVWAFVCEMELCSSSHYKELSWTLQLVPSVLPAMHTQKPHTNF